MTDTIKIKIEPKLTKTLSAAKKPAAKKVIKKPAAKKAAKKPAAKKPAAKKPTVKRTLKKPPAKKPAAKKAAKKPAAKSDSRSGRTKRIFRSSISEDGYLPPVPPIETAEGRTKKR